MRRVTPILIAVSLALNLAFLFHFRLELLHNLSIPRPSAIVSDALALTEREKGKFTGGKLEIPSSEWPDSIRALKPSHVWLANEGLMIHTFGMGLTRDGGYVVTSGGRPAHQQLYFYDTWYPKLYRWETTINE